MNRQTADDAGTKMHKTQQAVKWTIYTLLIINFVFCIFEDWATLSHWLYFWDELVWIGGFAAIEMNISERRDELLEHQETS